MIGDQFDSCAFHEGELLAQAKAGLVEEARRVHPMVAPVFPPAAGPLLATMRLLVVSATDEEGRVWATALTGPAGFLKVQDSLTLDVEAFPLPMDPLTPALSGTVSVGLITMDFARRRRVRVNGHSTGRDGGLVVTAEQVYGNCPRYIQARTPFDGGRSVEPRLLSRREDLSAEQQRFIRDADTFFVGTHAADGTADASHRGGRPGFVEVLSPTQLRFPDYNGNALMQTLGNMVADPRTGLLFVDFRTGVTLQVTGSTSIQWRPTTDQTRSGAERTILFEATGVVEIDPGNAPVWSDPLPSRFNP